MKKKNVMTVVLGSFLIILLFAIPSVNAANENSIPERLAKLEEAFKEQVSELLGTKSEISELKTLVERQQEQINEQKTHIDSLSTSVNELKINPPAPGNSKPEERLEFEGGTETIRIFLNEQIDNKNYPVPNQVVEVYDPKNLSDKLIGFTNYAGQVSFTVKYNVMYNVVYNGNEKFRPANLVTYGRSGNNLSTTYLQTLAY